MGDVTLLPCPFCGAIDHLVKHVSTYTSAGDGAGVSNSYRVVECRCSAHGPLADTYELATAAWNNRPAPALTPAQQTAEEMVEALRGIIAALELGGYMKRGEFYYYGVHDPAMTAPLAAARKALAKAGKP